MPDLLALSRALAEKFPANDVQFKPGKVSGNRAIAFPYIDARQVMDRLDNVVGTCSWQDDYTVLPSGEVMCKLSVRIGDEWVTKMDVGSKSDQADEGDKLKAAVSDSLKRAAVKFGIGRYLYSLDAIWCDFDPQKKRLVGKPQLPNWALPARQPATADRPTAPVHAELTAEQKATVLKLIEQSNTVPQSFCTHYAIATPSELHPEDYAKAVQLLRKRIAKNAEQAAKEPAPAPANGTAAPPPRPPRPPGGGIGNPQLAAIRSVQTKLRITEDELAGMLRASYKVDLLRKLTSAQGDEFLARLEKHWDAMDDDRKQASEEPEAVGSMA